MKLDSKKKLTARVLGIGRDRVLFDENRIEEIKEAITRQDVRDLVAAGAIRIKEIAGRKKNIKRTRRRNAGKIKKKLKHRKRDYIRLTRKLRNLIKELRGHGKIDKKKYYEIRKKIKDKRYRDKSHLWEDLK